MRVGGINAIATPRIRLVLRLCAALGVVVLAFHAAHHALGLGGRGIDYFTYNWLYDAVVVGAAIACLVRCALVDRERLPWLVLGIGLLFDATGEINYAGARAATPREGRRGARALRPRACAPRRPPRPA